jgi:hypothetical protein
MLSLRQEPAVNDIPVAFLVEEGDADLSTKFLSTVWKKWRYLDGAGNIQLHNFLTSPN